MFGRSSNTSQGSRSKSRSRSRRRAGESKNTGMQLLQNVVLKASRGVGLFIVLITFCCIVTAGVIIATTAPTETRIIGMQVQEAEKTATRVVLLQPQEARVHIVDISYPADTRSASAAAILDDTASTGLQATLTAGVMIDEWWGPVTADAATTPQEDVARELNRVFLDVAEGDIGDFVRTLWWRWFRWRTPPDTWSYQSLSRDAVSRTSIRWGHPTAAQLCSITVVNTTDTPGLAGAISDIIGNSGLRVVRVTTARAEETAPTSVLLTKTPSICAHSQAFLSPFWSEKRVDDSGTREARADLVLRVGDDVAAAYAELVQ